MNKTKLKEFETQETIVNDSQSTQETVTNQETKNDFNSNELLLNLVLDVSERYLPLSKMVGQFLSEKFLLEVDKAFVDSTLQAIKANPLKFDNEAVLKQARLRLQTQDYLSENRKALVASSEVTNAVTS